MFQKILIILLSFNILNANEYLDGSYTTVETFVYDTSDYLDTSFSGEDYDIENKDLIKGDIFYESIHEKSQDNINNSNLKLRLLFPRFRDKYKVTLENYNRSNSIDDTKESEDFLFGLTHNKARVGVKFRGLKMDPFVSYNLDTTQYLENESELYFGNRAIYFSDFGLDNTISANISKELNENMKISFDNSYRFQEEFNNRYELVHSLSLYNKFNSRKSLHYSITLYSTKDDIINPKLELDYCYSGVSYRNHFYKDWGYFQVDTGLTFRDENDFEPRGRVLFRIGALFGNAKPKFNK